MVLWYGFCAWGYKFTVIQGEIFPSVSVCLAFCHVLALVFPSYVSVFMFTFDMS